MKIHSQPMDLRDYFATAAMQGMVATISNQFELDRMREWAKQNGQTLSQFIASDSYKQADAMIYEREKGTVITDGGNWIHLRYVGRGTEQIQLELGDQFSIKTKIAYLSETLKRLAEIRKELRGG